MKSLFLHGYGLGIKVKNTRLVFSQGLDPFSDKRKILEIPSTACNFDTIFPTKSMGIGIESHHVLSFNDFNSENQNLFLSEFRLIFFSYDSI
jgi:hypothetical protein